MKTFMESSWFNKLIAVFGILVVALAIFWLGTVVGSRHAEFSSRWSNHYAENFGGMRSPFAMPSGSGSPGDDRLDASNGAVGTVMSVNLPNIAVKNQSEAEKVIVVGSTTIIRKMRSPATVTDIRVGDFLVTVGTPDDQGRIVATFVRIMPTPLRTAAVSTSSQNK
ncbi:MAG: hypothetical protein JWO00_203 [Candidatus Parcubacteria bacterium]|nr:hypothetical protein [Candidatus Parcubacteria bacterium]